MWHWFIFLIIIGFLQLVVEAVCIFVPGYRAILLKQNLPADAQIKRLEKFTTGQWFLLYQIGRNMDQHFFYEFFKRVPDVTTETGKGASTKDIRFLGR